MTPLPLAKSRALAALDAHGPATAWATLILHCHGSPVAERLARFWGNRMLMGLLGEPRLLRQWIERLEESP